MAETTSRTFACHADVDDVAYSANVTLLLHATQGGISLQGAFLFCKFQANHLLNWHVKLFSTFAPNIMLSKHVEHHKTDAK